MPKIEPARPLVKRARRAVAVKRSNAKAATAPSDASAEHQLDGFIAKFSPPDQKRIRSVRSAMRKRLPTAHEMVYDNYNFFVIGYSPTLRPLDAPVSIAAGPESISLCFLYGAKLPDPQRVLLGSGTQTRFVRLDSAATLRRPEIAALLDAAVARAKAPFTASGRGSLVIRSISAKQRPRRRPEP